MSEGNGSAVREAILEFVQETTGNPDAAAPGDDEPITNHVEDVFDACELSIRLEDRFPDSKSQIEKAMQQLGMDEGMINYNPETATLRTYADLYAALDGVK